MLDASGGGLIILCSAYFYFFHSFQLVVYEKNDSYILSRYPMCHALPYAPCPMPHAPCPLCRGISHQLSLAPNNPAAINQLSQSSGQ